MKEVRVGVSELDNNIWTLDILHIKRFWMSLERLFLYYQAEFETITMLQYWSA